jgi:uncharacterized protein (DUF2062 family)
VNNPRNFNWLDRLKRLARHKLHIPMTRSTHSPAHIARGVAVGVVWASTPIFGLQMISVFLTWVVARKLFGWDFSLVNGLAWTWATNAFTIIPSFYIFWLTGQVMLGRFDDLTGYSSFKSIVDNWNVQGSDLFETSTNRFIALFDTVGLPLTIGCIPWAIICSWVAYKLSYRFVATYRKRRTECMVRSRT